MLPFLTKILHKMWGKKKRGWAAFLRKAQVWKACRTGTVVWTGRPLQSQVQVLEFWGELPGRTWGFKAVRTRVESDCKTPPNFHPSLYPRPLQCDPQFISSRDTCYFLHLEYGLALWLAYVAMWQWDSTKSAFQDACHLLPPFISFSLPLGPPPLGPRTSVAGPRDHESPCGAELNQPARSGWLFEEMSQIRL